MSDVTVEYPPGFDDYAWEVVAKGWFSGVVAVIYGRRYSITVYDPARLAQDIAEELESGEVFLERNLLVVRAVTPENIAIALAEVVKSGKLGDLRPDDAPSP